MLGTADGVCRLFPQHGEHVICPLLKRESVPQFACETRDSIETGVLLRKHRVGSAGVSRTNAGRGKGSSRHILSCSLEPGGDSRRVGGIADREQGA